MGPGAIGSMPLVDLGLKVISHRQELAITGHERRQNLLESLPERGWLNTSTRYDFLIHQVM